MKDERGFTLLEVMVALAVLAILSLALLAASSALLRQHSQVETRLLAAWVASNKASSWRLQGAPALGATQRERVPFAGRVFVLETGFDTVDSIEPLIPAFVSVSLDRPGATPLYRLDVWLEVRR